MLLFLLNNEFPAFATWQCDSYKLNWLRRSMRRENTFFLFHFEGIKLNERWLF